MADEPPEGAQEAAPEAAPEDAPEGAPEGATEGTAEGAVEGAAEEVPETTSKEAGGVQWKEDEKPEEVEPEPVVVVRRRPKVAWSDDLSHDSEEDRGR